MVEQMELCSAPLPALGRGIVEAEFKGSSGLPDEPWEREPGAKVIQYRKMERDVTDPLALGLLHEIVSELEAALQQGPSSASSAPQRSDRRVR
jgi:hypothetical protein